MRYALTCWALGDQPTIDLTRNEFDEIVAARNRLLEALALEDMFNVALGNYEEFERELLSITLSDATYSRIPEHAWDEYIDDLQRIARRLANVLSTARSYTDFLKQAVAAIAGRSSPTFATVNTYLEESRGVFGYRVCEELRNYSQHRGSPVHGFSSNSEWRDRKDGGRYLVRSFAPQASVERLSDDPRLASKPVLAELKALAAQTRDNQDLRPFVREYISTLGRLHLKVRTLLAPAVSAADAVMTEAIDKFCRLPESNGATGLVAVELTDEGLRGPRAPLALLREFVTRRRRLEQRNSMPTHFEVTVITNELEGRK